MDKLKNDTTFFLRSFFYKQEQSLEEYKVFQKEIRDNGFQIITSNEYKVKVYTPELCLIFISRDLPVREQFTKIETKINGYDYLQTYIDGYKEGEQYFDDEFRISPNTLYGENAEDYVKDIHYNFFHVRIDVGAGHEGWIFVKEKFSLLLTKKSIKEYGYYSGIVSKVEEQVKKYPRLFKKFDKCENDLPALQSKKFLSLSMQPKEKKEPGYTPKKEYASSNANSEETELPF